MIRFVMLGEQIGGLDDNGAPTLRYAWYDTVRDRFVEGYDGQTQTFDRETLLEDIANPESPIRQYRDEARLLAMIPEDVRSLLIVPATLWEQIDEISARRVNSTWAEHVARHTRVERLAALAFREQWPESSDTRAIRHAANCVDAGTFAHTERSVP